MKNHHRFLTIFALQLTMGEMTVVGVGSLSSESREVAVTRCQEVGGVCLSTDCFDVTIMAICPGHQICCLPEPRDSDDWYLSGLTFSSDYQIEREHCGRARTCRKYGGRCTNTNCTSSEDQVARCGRRGCVCCAKSCQTRSKCVRLGGFCTRTYGSCSGEVRRMRGACSGRGCACCIPAETTTSTTTTITTTTTTTTVTATSEANPTTNVPTTTGTLVPLAKKCKCGIANRKYRIVGGVETEVNEYPWHVGIGYHTQARPWCGGSLISASWVLTAGHCMFNREGNLEKPHYLSVQLGSHDVYAYENSRVRAKVQRIIIHEDYDTPVRQNHDIALLKLTSPVEYTKYIQPVCLPSPTNNFDNVQCLAIGWGNLRHNGDSSPVLMEVSVPTMSNANCRYILGDLITDNMICAGYPEGGKDSCQGDSGGPLMSESEDRHAVIGIVSWGYGCALPGLPGVYTRVTEYLGWISSKTKEDFTCEI